MACCSEYDNVPHGSIRDRKFLDQLRSADFWTLPVLVGCLHPVACTRSGSGFPSNATLF
jgi:hypothetical protein